MSDVVEINFGRPIPLFPLPNVVLLPHATLPLHIFETRYRQMVNDALDEHGLIAMASFEGEDWKRDYEGNPPLRDVACVGYILRHHEMADGRFNLLLQGVCRASIVEEVHQTPYRAAMLEPIEQDRPMEIDLTDQRQRLLNLLGDETLQQLASVKAIDDWVSDEVPTHALADLAGMTVCDSLEQRYDLLSEPDLHARLQWLEQHLLATRRLLRRAATQGDAVSEEGWPLN